MDASYIAGFMDGEGSFSLAAGGSYRSNGKDRRPTYRPQISATQTRKGVLDQIRDFFDAGKVYEVRQREGRRPSWVWAMSGHRLTVPVIERLLPHLIVKKEVAQVMLDFSRRRIEQRTRALTQVDAEFVRRVRALNNRHHGRPSSARTKAFLGIP